VESLKLDQRNKEIERWLSPPDPSTNYINALEKRYEDTGLWFLQSDSFMEWKTRRNSFLWLHGIPGCGKTILSSAIIEDLKNFLSSKTVLYFYFDFNDSRKQTHDNMVRSLISQLYYRSDETSKLLESLFSSCEDGRQQPTYESLCKVLLQMIEQIKEVWVVLDALDECSTRRESPTKGLLMWMRDLRKSDERNVHLLITSQPKQDIESGVREFAQNNELVPIQSDHITRDIRAYVRMRLTEDKGLKRWQSRPDVQQEIEDLLMKKANGM
jgi:hypothetical protein